jgi:hypothetical protein
MAIYYIETPSRAHSRWFLAGAVVFLVIPSLLFPFGNQ